MVSPIPAVTPEDLILDSCPADLVMDGLVPSVLDTLHCLWFDLLEFITYITVSERMTGFSSEHMPGCGLN